VTLLVLLGVSVDEPVDTSSTDGSSCDALALLASPGTSDLAAAEGFNGTSDNGSFGGLLPLLGLVVATASTARPGIIAAVAAIVVVAVPVAIIATVIVTIVSTAVPGTRTMTASDCCDDASEADCFTKVLG